MKKLTILLTALALLLLLCACTDRAESTDATTESAAAQTTEAATEQTAPDTEQTAPDTEAAASDPSAAEGAEDEGKLGYVVIIGGYHPAVRSTFSRKFGKNPLNFALLALFKSLQLVV